MALRVTHLSESDLSGGAARAAYRIHRSLSRYISPDILQTIHEKKTADEGDTRSKES